MKFLKKKVIQALTAFMQVLFEKHEATTLTVNHKLIILTKLKEDINIFEEAFQGYCYRD